MKSSSYENGRLKQIAKSIDSFGGATKRIIDLGFAHRPNEYLLKNKDNHVVGIDLEENKTKIRYHEEHILNIHSDLSFLGKFDVIVASELIEHLEEPYSFLRNIHAISHDNTNLILSTPNPLGFPVCFAEFFRSKRYYFTDDHKFYFPPRWIERMLTHTGWKLSKTIQVGFWFFGIPLQTPLSILSYQLIYIAKKMEKH